MKEREQKMKDVKEGSVGKLNSINAKIISFVVFSVVLAVVVCLLTIVPNAKKALEESTKAYMLNDSIHLISESVSGINDTVGESTMGVTDIAAKTKVWNVWLS